MRNLKESSAVSSLPFESKVRIVIKDWIDYNGHMNVTYYTYVFDQAIDEFLESELGIGPSFIKENQQGSYALQTQYRYLRELRLGEEFKISIIIADFDQKRLHLMAKMYKLGVEEVTATCESILMNVDLITRRSCNYSESLKNRIERLFELSKPLLVESELGHSLGLKRKKQKA